MKHLLLNTVARALMMRQDAGRGERYNLERVRAILLIESARLGDVVVLLTLLESLRNRFPHATFTVAVRRQYERLFDCLGARPFTIPLGDKHGMSASAHALRAISHRHFDLVCSPSPSHFNALLALLTASDMKVGYFTSYHEQTPFLYNHVVESVGIRIPTGLAFHHMNLYQRPGLVATALGAARAGSVAWSIPDSALDGAERLIGKDLKSLESPLIVLHVAAGWKYRQWPIDCFLSLAKLIKTEIACTMAVIGIRELGQDVSNMTARFRDSGVLIVETQPEVDELAALISRSSLLVGNDSGPLHLAASLGIPTIGLYGPAPPELTAPSSPVHQSFYVRLDCSPCTQVRCVRPADPCMAHVRVEDVAASALTMIRARKSQTEA